MERFSLVRLEGQLQSSMYLRKDGEFVLFADAEDRIRELEAERDKLQVFKNWVHAYLTAKGIPENPGGQHTAEGCRIGDRMDLLVAERDAEMERVKACEHIAEGEMDWQVLSNLCPSTAAVSKLRRDYDAAIARAETAEDSSRCLAESISSDLRSKIAELESALSDRGDKITAFRQALECTLPFREFSDQYHDMGNSAVLRFRELREAALADG